MIFRFFELYVTFLQFVAGKYIKEIICRLSIKFFQCENGIRFLGITQLIRFSTNIRILYAVTIVYRPISHNSTRSFTNMRIIEAKSIMFKNQKSKSVILISIRKRFSRWPQWLKQIWNVIPDLFNSGECCLILGVVRTINEILLRITDYDKW